MESIIQEKLERIYCKGDTLLMKLVGIGTTISLLLGMLYGTIQKGILLSLFLSIIFFCLRYLFPKNFITRLLMCSIGVFFVGVFVVVTEGNPEIRGLYFVTLPLFIVYQDPRLIVGTTIIAVGFSTLTFYLQGHEAIPQEYLYSNREADTKSFLIQTVSLILHGIVCFWLAFRFRVTLLKKLSKDLEQEKQHNVIQKNIAIAEEISRGNLNIAYTAEEDDALGQALYQMRENLREATEKDRQEKFKAEGLAQMAEILRRQLDVQELSYQVISYLVKYLKANQGALFLLQGEEDNDPHLDLTTCYAYERRKYNRKRIEIGEGLLGQAMLEKDSIYLTEIPDQYIRITSGLGQANPSSVLIVPLKLNERVEGVIELASFQTFPRYQIEFVEKLGESIASTITNVKINEKTRHLLEESQIQAEQMRAQEEEMRQNMEELQATQEEMARSQRELEEARGEAARIREEEKQRLNEQLNSQKHIMKSTLNKLKAQIDELKEQIKHKDDTLQQLNNVTE